MSSMQMVSGKVYRESFGEQLVGSAYETLFVAALSAATAINSHLDFLNWLQCEVQAYIPHDALLVAWGDFESGEVSYDVASTLPGIRTQSVRDVHLIDKLLVDFFQHALKSGKGWALLHHTDWPAIFGATEAGLPCGGVVTPTMKSVLAYSLGDKRNRQDCLYLFFSRDDVIPVDPLILDLLIPQVDRALRRVDCLPAGKTGDCAARTSSIIDALSEREREVLHWVGMGKSNEEIGTILKISHNTVKNHLKRIFSKLGVSARSQAVQAYANLSGRRSSAAL